MKRINNRTNIKKTNKPILSELLVSESNLYKDFQFTIFYLKKKLTKPSQITYKPWKKQFGIHLTNILIINNQSQFKVNTK